MAFSEEQVKQLSGKLSGKHVKTRVRDGFTLSYFETVPNVFPALRGHTVHLHEDGRVHIEMIRGCKVCRAKKDKPRPGGEDS